MEQWIEVIGIIKHRKLNLSHEVTESLDLDTLSVSGVTTGRALVGKLRNDSRHFHLRDTNLKPNRYDKKLGLVTKAKQPIRAAMTALFHF